MITDTRDQLLQDDVRQCNITNYRTGSIPDDLPDCRAISYGGIPTIEMAYKLEETDMGMDNYDDYMSSLHYEQDAYMRNAVTDRNCEMPFSEADLPGYNTTRISGALNLRYNGGRGTTDYEPAHPEMMIGQDPFAGEDTGLKLAELKKFTAQRANDASVRMGDNAAFEIPEQPWADPEISYAKKDAMVWTSKIKNIWQWPQFENFQTSHKTEINVAGEKKRKFECGEHCVDEEIYGDASYDKEGKVRHTQVGYDYALGKYQAHTMDFDEGQKGQVRSTKHPERFELLRNDVKDGHNIIDHTEKTKVFKSKLFEAMKSAVDQQDFSGKMGNSVKGEKVKSGKEFENRSVIKDIVETQNRKKETMTVTRSGVHPDIDAGYLKRHSKNHMRNTLQIKSNMVKGSRNDGDLGYIQRDIANSMKLNREDKSRLCASGMVDPVDRNAIMREIATTHKTGCSEKGKCFSGYNGTTQEHSLVDTVATTQTLPDTPYTHVRSSQLLEENPRSKKDYIALTDDVLETNISDTSRFEGGRNRW